MNEDPRVDEIIDRLLNTPSTPEEACADWPELLPEVSDRWRKFCWAQARIEELFPNLDVSTANSQRLGNDQSTLPQISGFEVLEVLGRGGMGVVYKARHLKLNCHVAIKMLLSGPFAGPLELSRFRRETEAVAALRHPGIVQIYDVGECGHQPYFTMEYLEGGSLSQRVKHKPQDVSDASEMIAELASAVHFAHKSGFIHRDLKPGNVLLTAAGVPKITDFGLARSIELGPELTLSGERLGTPSYMAPEQAMGKASEIGPSVDIYALGAILYEMLTGRPPFEGHSAAETERRVIMEEPVPPSRLNRSVPIDLEKVCLKCLRKSPSRRYPSAQDLVEDLYRFLDGKPVLARPVGHLERTFKWARRRPMPALLIFLAIMITATGAWLGYQERTRRQLTATRRNEAHQTIHCGILQAYELGKAMRLAEAKLILDEQTKYLANADSEDLTNRLERAKGDLEFAQDLVQSRDNAVEQAQLVGEEFMRALINEYRAAFAKAGLTIEGDAATVADLIRASPLAEITVSALDEWALAAYSLGHLAEGRQLLAIAQSVDPDPVWRDRFRNPDAWDNLKSICKLADDASAVPDSPLPHQLMIIAKLLRSHGAKREAAEFLLKAIRRRPTDFWLNWELGNEYYHDQKMKEAMSFYRVVVALRPGKVWSLNALGCSLFYAGNEEEGIAHFRTAFQLDPHRALTLKNLNLSLRLVGRIEEAVTYSKCFYEAEPNNPDAASVFASALSTANRQDAAIVVCRKGLATDASHFDCQYKLGECLFLSGRLEEAIVELHKAIALRNDDIVPHINLGIALHKLGQHEEAVKECEWVMTAMDTRNKRQDANPGEGGVELETYAHARGCGSISLFSLGRFAQADEAAKAYLALPADRTKNRPLVHHVSSLCRQLIPVEPHVPSILAGKAVLDDPARTIALAEWCANFRRLPVTAVRLYEDAFKKRAALADDLNARHRFNAARAAALAAGDSTGQGARLDESVRREFREKAIAWLRADYAVFAGWQNSHNERVALAPLMTEYLKAIEFSGVRDQAALDRLSEAERKGWQSLWADVARAAQSDPWPILERARVHADRKEWAKAAELYGRFDKLFPVTGLDDRWYEYAAVQVLAGDSSGYRRTCQVLLNEKNIRSYLVARACTLQPATADQVKLAQERSATELKDSQRSFWALTEAGAICVRSNRENDAIPLLHKSLEAKSKPGAAVLNWLWLALAHYQHGDRDQARSWLRKATDWLDAVGNELPANAETFGLHRHNWLEAQILRRELESQLYR